MTSTADRPTCASCSRAVARAVPYTTPNPRVFICSSSTPPGGGVHGCAAPCRARRACAARCGEDHGSPHVRAPRSGCGEVGIVKRPYGSTHTTRPGPASPSNCRTVASTSAVSPGAPLPARHRTGRRCAGSRASGPEWPPDLTYH
jgi:hypothetical protein